MSEKKDTTLSKTHNNLGVIYLGKNDLQKAAVHFKKAIAGDPANFPAYNNLANVYRQMGKVKEATKYYLKAIDGNPNLPEPYNNLGRVYFEQGEFKKAARCFSEALKINPNGEHFLLMATYNEMGNLYKRNHDLTKAIKYYQKAIEIGPKTAIVYCNLGQAFGHQGKFDLAIQYLKKAIEIDPKYADAHYNLGVLYLKIERWDLAKESFQNTLKVNPQFGPALSLLTFVLLQQCDWLKYPEVAAKLDKIILKELKGGLKTSETPLLNVIKNENPKVNLEVARSWSKSLEKKVTGVRPNFHFAKNKGDKQLTIGYLSSDFYDHATAHLILGLFKLHDRNKFKIYGYSYGMDDGSFYRKEIKRNCDKFVDLVNLGDIEAAKKIYKDNVDILVDLKGYTQNSRLEICALRPAPIQVTWLGFPGTTGATFFDYLIADKVIVPQEHAKYFNEKLVYLPSSYQVNDCQQKIARKAFKKSDFGLPEEGFVFCFLGQNYKIDQVMFSTWMRILKAVPRSVLWLWWGSPEAKNNLKKEAEKEGIESRRLVFSKSLPKSEHLARLKLGDLMLDARICNGHTTTSDSLWAGVPVITLKGKHFASRVSASLLTAIDLPELITNSLHEYKQLAIDLAKHPQKMKKLKEKLAKNRLTKPLFNTQKFVANLEKAYNGIYANC